MFPLFPGRPTIVLIGRAAPLAGRIGIRQRVQFGWITRRLTPAARSGRAASACQGRQSRYVGQRQTEHNSASSDERDADIDVFRHGAEKYAVVAALILACIGMTTGFSGLGRAQSN